MVAGFILIALGILSLVAGLDDPEQTTQGMVMMSCGLVLVYIESHFPKPPSGKRGA
jgi:hypothetical protein